MQNYTIDELMQAARTAVDGFKKSLSEYIASNDRCSFDVSKHLFDNALFGMHHLILCSDADIYEVNKFEKHIISMKEELAAIKWPEK